MYIQAQMFYVGKKIKLGVFLQALYQLSSQPQFYSLACMNSK